MHDWPFRGRATELARLSRAVLDPASRAIAISGPPGVGKTRLATETIHEVDERVCVIRVVATHSLASVPLGAFAPVLAALDSNTVDVDVLRAAHAELRARAGGRRLALFVDDAHALDDISAGLTQQVALDGDSVVVLTVRSDEHLPDAIAALKKSDTCVDLYLPALDEASVSVVLHDALGPIDGTTRQRLWHATEGNLLLLRELLDAGIADGRLLARDGIWMWEGPLASARIIELFAHRLDAYDDEQRRALELVALGDPLGLALLTQLIPEPVVQHLERDGMLRVVRSERRHNVVLGHPLYGEVVRERMGDLTRAVVARQLADLVDSVGARRKEDLLRVASWRLDSGGAIDGARLARAARVAIVRQDLPLAERLAHAAAEHGAGAEAVVHLTEALYWQGRHTEAEAIYASFDDDAIDPRARRALAISRAGNLFWGLGRTADALANLSPDDDWSADERADAHGQRALIEVMSGLVPQGLATARSVLDGPDEGYGRARAAGASVLGLATSGATRTALDFADDAFAFALALGDHDPMPVGSVLVGRLLALFIDGDGSRAEELASSFETMSAQDATDVYRGLWPLLTGRALLARGHLDAAVARLREAAALLSVTDAAHVRSWCLGALAQAAGQCGDVTTAQAAANDALDTPKVRWLWDAEIHVGAAWAHLAAGEHARAESAVLAAAERACAHGQLGTAALVLHELIRLGAPARALPVLEQIDIESDRADLVRAQATAILERDGTRLDELADRLAARGTDLLAAECAACAADAHLAAGLRARQLASRQRARELLRPCGPARTPSLLALEAPELAYLTAREKEVAELAATGLTRNEIGNRLGVTDRTVANHLTHIYAKLHVTNRTELAKLLGIEL